jgi:hypothetical protein
MDWDNSFSSPEMKSRMAVVGAVAAVSKAIESMTGMNNDDTDRIIDREVIESAVDSRGIGAVTDPAVLESAINYDELDSSVDNEDLQRSVEDQLSKR